MIGHVFDVSYSKPCDVPKQMKDAAAGRHGDWEVTTYDWETKRYLEAVSTWFGACATGMCGVYKNGYTLRKTTIKLRESEVARFLHIFFHGYRNKSKVESIHSNLEQAAETMWPTGSLEHVAMRFLAPPILVRVFAGHKVRIPATHTNCICAFFGYTHLRTQLLRCHDLSSGALNHTGDGKKVVTNQPKIDSSVKPTILEAMARPFSAPSAPEPPKPIMEGYTEAHVHAMKEQEAARLKQQEVADADQFRRERGPTLSSIAACEQDFADYQERLRLERLASVKVSKHGGNTPEDAEIIANEENRMVDKEGVKMIVGQDYYGDDLDTKQIVGVLTMPTPKMPNVYNNSSSNAKAAKQKRLVEKARPWQEGVKKEQRDADVKKIAGLVGEACGSKKHLAVFSTKRIQEWAETHFHLRRSSLGSGPRRGWKIR